MTALPVPGAPVGGFSCAWLMVARSSTTWALALITRAQTAPARTIERTGVIFMVGKKDRAAHPRGHAPKRNNMVRIAKRSVTASANQCRVFADATRRFDLNFRPTRTSNVPSMFARTVSPTALLALTALLA